MTRGVPLRLAMVGGGPGSFIGPVHRMAAELDGAIELVAGAFSRDAQKQPAPKEQKQPVREPSGVVIHPDGRPEIQRQRIVIPEQQEHVQKGLHRSTCSA